MEGRRSEKSILPGTKFTVFIRNIRSGSSGWLVERGVDGTKFTVLRLSHHQLPMGIDEFKTRSTWWNKVYSFEVEDDFFWPDLV
jgi:hypothetical protein